MADAGLEQLRQTIPAARSLPLLQLLASGQPGRWCWNIWMTASWR
jgi:hypothetical protein